MHCLETNSGFQLKQKWYLYGELLQEETQSIKHPLLEIQKRKTHDHLVT